MDIMISIINLFYNFCIMWDRLNRVWNTLCTAPRVAVTWLHTVEDTTKTALYSVLNPVEWIWKTACSIKDAVHNACNASKWAWYKAPLSLLATPFMAVEWVAETLWHSWCHLLSNIKDTIAHPFINFWNSIKWIWSKNKVKDFSFQKVDSESVSPRNRLASLFN